MKENQNGQYEQYRDTMNWWQKEEMKIILKKKCTKTNESEKVLKETKKESKMLMSALYLSTLSWHRKNYPGLSTDQINMLLAKNLEIMDNTEMIDLIQKNLFWRLGDPENEMWKKIDMHTANTLGLFNRPKREDETPIIITREASTSTQGNNEVSSTDWTVSHEDTNEDDSTW